VCTLSFRNAGRDGKGVRHGRKGNMQAIFDTTDKVEEGNISKGKRQCDITEYVLTEICISVGRCFGRYLNFLHNWPGLATLICTLINISSHRLVCCPVLHFPLLCTRFTFGEVLLLQPVVSIL
jgi:hypothetical protein